MRFHSSVTGSGLSFYFPYDGLVMDFYGSALYRRVHDFLVTKGYSLRYIIDNRGYYTSSDGVSFCLENVERGLEDKVVVM